MGDISAHFNRSEFSCECGCGFDTVDTETIRVLEIVRQQFMRPVYITSGCRCADHNYRIGGSQNSQHILGRAVDFKVKDVEPKEVYEFLDKLYPDSLGLGLYSSWCHMDTRTNSPARWRD